jgi:hypothetical protein
MVWTPSLRLPAQDTTYPNTFLRIADQETSLAPDTIGMKTSLLKVLLTKTFLCPTIRGLGRDCFCRLHLRLLIVVSLQLSAVT